MTTAADLSEGSLLAGFRVGALVGRGGMGVVYRATQLSLERWVALKVVAPELAGDGRFRERFLREARLAASLDHPHVLPVYEAGEADGVLFIAMRLVEGDSLEERLRRDGRLAPGSAATLIGQLADALGAAHEAGLVHRDVKPANVLLTRAGEREHAYLCDFGLSRRVTGATQLTRADGFVGSAAYAAPEQIRGEDVDGRTDVYALGCVFFECLTGRRPFERDDDLALMWAHMHEPPPRPGELDPSLAAFDDVIARALAKEPGDRPSVAELVRALVHVDEAAPAIPSAEARPAGAGRLPVPASSFLGRDRELAELRARVKEGARLVTLTGPGGTGKTRLALQAAGALASEFRDGVFWVGLAALRDPALVTESIAQAVSAKDGPAEHIGERQLLLLLDNFEQVVGAAPGLSALLHACPNLTLLVTSRELLRVDGEVEYAVPPLAETEAVAMFCERAQIQPSDEIRELCGRLDNLPLAVELAAARTKALSPAQILERLPQRLDLFKGGRDADPRQHTLRATVEWSYGLLDGDEQRLFRALSAFAGGCTLEAAEHVADADVDTLQSLVEKSLLRFTNERYWMLETIREFALERLGAAEEPEPVRRHAAFYVEFAAKNEEQIRANRAALLDVVEAERPNISAAVESLAAAGDGDAARRLVGSLWLFWFFRGRFREGQSLTDIALAAPPEGNPELRVDALWGSAKFSFFTGNIDRAGAAANELLELGERHGLSRGIAIATELLAMAEATSGNIEAARRLYARSLQLSQDSGDAVLMASVTNNFGALELEDGNYETARRLFGESLAVGRALGDRHRIAIVLGNLGFAEHLLGSTEAARSHLAESLRTGASLGYREGVAYALLGLALSEEPTRGLVLVGASDAMHEELEMSRPPFERELRDDLVRAAESALGSEQYREALSRGRLLSVEDVARFALKATGGLAEHRVEDAAERVATFQTGDGVAPSPETIASRKLPRPASSFVGRQRELGEALSKLDDGARLVTLTGAGGSGKTRLALEMAARLMPRYRDGAHWVGLAALRDPALVTDSIAHALGAKQELSDHVGERELLLLLDNFEQVIDAAGDVSALLRACPNLCLLVTSRERLRVEGEVEYPVPPLAEPEAVSLFCERAQTQPSDEIRELCARLDNLPLAVELAAARTKALSPAQILERVSKRLDLLKGGRDADPRQQTLRATIEWSYDLLSDEEQRLFRALSVFAGGCTLEVAEQVADADLDTLQSLVEKSLLRFTSERYWMLETIRDYARDGLHADDDRERLEQRHADHYLGLAESVRANDESEAREDGRRLLADEHANLRMALAWFHDARRSDDELRLVCALAEFWYMRGHYHEGRAYIEAALENDAPQPPALRAKALAAASDFVRTLGAVDQARRFSEESLALSRQLGDDAGVARALHELGETALEEEEYEHAVELFDEAIAVGRGSGMDGAGSLANLGFAALLQRDYERAAALSAEALALFRQRGTSGGVIVALGNLAEAKVGLGKLDEGRIHVTECLELAREAQFQEVFAACLETAATLLLETGDAETAARLTGAADGVLEQINFSPHPAEQRRRELLRADLRARLPASAEDLRDEGRRMTVDDASRCALDALSTLGTI